MAQPTTTLRLPTERYTMPRQFSTVFNGKIYAGKPDTDPTAAANRITVYQEAEAGQQIPVAQPVSINAGGFPVINGQVVKLVVAEDYSLAVCDHLGAQVYYFPRCNGPYILNVFHDQTLHGTGTEADKLGVKLSAEAGNLLEIRGDGLYYGVTATDDLLNLYVDSKDGSDGNKGTKDKPFKTLNKALSVTPSNKSNTIFLKAGQTFSLGIPHSVAGCVRQIRVYDDPYIDGDKVPALSPDNPTYTSWAAKEVSRPVVKSKAVFNDTSHIVTVHNFEVSAGGRLVFEAIILDVAPDNGGQHPDWPVYTKALVYGDSTSAVDYFGCILVTQGPADPANKWTVLQGAAEGKIPSASYCRCVLLQGGSFCDIAEVPARVMIRDDWPESHKVPYLDGNLVQAAKDGKLSGIIRGPGGEPRNLMINFVV